MWLYLARLFFFALSLTDLPAASFSNDIATTGPYGLSLPLTTHDPLVPSGLRYYSASSMEITCS